MPMKSLSYSISRVAGSSALRTSATARFAKGAQRSFSHRNVSLASPRYQSVVCQAEADAEAVTPVAESSPGDEPEPEPVKVEKVDMSAAVSDAIPIFSGSRIEDLAQFIPVNVSFKNSWGKPTRPAEKSLMEGQDISAAVMSADIIPVELFEEQKTFVIGTADGCEVKLPFVDIGDKHAEISFKDGKVYVTDLGTETGTTITCKVEKVTREYIRGRFDENVKLTPNEPTEILPGNTVVFGSNFAKFEYRVPTMSEAFEVGRPPEFMEAVSSRYVSKKSVPSGPKVFHLIPKGKEAAKDALTPERFLFEAKLSEESTSVPVMTVGTDEGCNIVLPSSDYVDGVHARLDLKGTDVYVTDLGSVNGTKVCVEVAGGVKRAPTLPGVPMCVRPGDLVQFGVPDASYRLAVNDCYTLKPIKSDIKVKPWSTKSKPPKADELVGDVEPKDWKAPEFPLLFEGESVTVGSESSCDIVIPLIYVSGTHAKVERKSGSLFVTDLGSTNGTRVRDLTSSKIRECVSKEPVEIAAGDFVEFGSSGEYVIYQNVNK